MKILVETLFDCSATGTTGNFRPANLPYRDRCDTEICDYPSWARSRNQQRNWETLLQVMGLRCQLDDIEPSQQRNNRWYFSFIVDNSEIFGDSDDLVLLKQDCQGVPMVTGLHESPPQVSVIITQGPDQNIWFKSINI